MDGSKCRMLIKEGCEWVNVSSDTGLPGVVPNQRQINGCL